MFDLSQVKSNSFEPVPDGKYIAFCTEAAMKDTRAGGMLIAATFTITGGEYEGRKLFAKFNVQNSNPKATEIGLAQLKSLLECSGFPDPNKLGDVGQLGGLRVGIKTKIRKSDEYGDKAEISYFYKPDATQPTGGMLNENIGF